MSSNDRIAPAPESPRDVRQELSWLIARVGADLQPVFEKVCEVIVDVIGDGCAVRLLTPDRNFVYIAAATHRDPRGRALQRALLKLEQPHTEGLSGEILQTAKPILLNGLPATPTRHLSAPFLAFSEAFPARALIAAPLRTDEATFGQLVATRNTPDRPYEPRDLQLLEELAERASLAIANARAQARLEEARERQATLARASTTLAESLDYEATLRTTVGLVVPLLGDFGFFDLVESEGLVRRIARAHDDPKRQALLEASTWERSAHPSMNLCALSSGEAALHAHVDDAWREGAALNDAHLASMRALEFQSMLTVPLRVRGEVVGALTLFHAEGGRRHTLADLELASDLAARAALAVKNALQVRELQLERKRQRESEERLRTSEQRLALVTDSIPSLVAYIDAQFRYQFANKSYERWFGVDPESIVGMPVEDLVGAAAAANIRGPFQRALSGETVLFEENMPYRLGVARDVRGTYVPHRAADGSVDGVVALVEDVTAQKRTRDALEFLFISGKLLGASLDPEETLAALARVAVPSLADWCAIDLVEDGKVIQAAIYHSDPEKLAIGQAYRRDNPVDLAKPGALQRAIATREAVLVSHVTDEMVQAVPEAQRRMQDALGLRSVLVLPLQAHERMLGALTLVCSESGRHFDAADVPHLEEVARQASAAIENARLFQTANRERARAEEASRAKDEFLAMLGHELRNPLMPIVTALDIMDLGPDRERQVKERGMIRRQVHHLRRLVDDLLDIARVTRGRLELKKARLELGGAIRTAVETASVLLDERRHRLVMNVPTEGLVVDADEARIVQVISNLLTNAAKYTPIGGLLEVTASTEGSEAVVSVRDNGVGIAPAMMPTMFDSFIQGAREIDRSQGGLGLGLAIVRRITELHGGTVRATSDGVGKGSTFTVRLPLAVRPERAVETPTLEPVASASAQRRVLIVDDNVDAAEILRLFLSLEGHEARAYYDGPSALRALEEFNPEVAVLDIGLPLMDGYELAARIHAVKPRTRLFALTGYGQESDKARAAEAGFERHFTKPTDPETLLRSFDVQPDSPTS